MEPKSDSYKLLHLCSICPYIERETEFYAIYKYMVYDQIHRFVNILWQTLLYLQFKRQSLKNTYIHSYYEHLAESKNI